MAITDGEKLTPVECASPWSDFEIIQCLDGKSRRTPRVTQSILQRIFDGLPDIMGPDWNSIISEIKKETIKHATKSNQLPSEVLREMLNYHASQTLQRTDGRLEAVPESQILLLTMCQLARDLGAEFDGATQILPAICETCLRIMWEEGSTSRSSCERELEGSSTGKPSNFVHGLPLVCHLSLHNRKEIKCLHCAEKSRKMGMCQKHFQRWKKYGDPFLTKIQRANGYELVRVSS